MNTTQRVYKYYYYKDLPVRVIISYENEKMIGRIKCCCSSILKNHKSLDKHITTESHKKNMQYKVSNIPCGKFSMLLLQHR